MKVENYLDCCSELMRIYNISQNVRLHDANEPFCEFRQLDCFSSEDIGLKRLRNLFSHLKQIAIDKAAFVRECDHSVEVIRLTDKRVLPFSQLVTNVEE